MCGNEAMNCRDGLPYCCFVRLVDSIFIFSLRVGKTKIFIKLLLSFLVAITLHITVRRYILVAALLFLPCPFTRIYENFYIVSVPLHRQLNIPAVSCRLIFIKSNNFSDQTSKFTCNC